MSRIAQLAIVPSMLILLTSPASAEAPKRLSVQAVAGLNTVLPTYEVQVGYRLPVWEDRLEAFVSYAPWSASLSTATFSIAQVGGRAYFGSHDGPLQPFGVASLGLADNSYSGLAPALMVGAGLDWMFLPSVGLTGSLTLGFPTLVRPMLGLRVAF